jgi:hypothetical protein
MTKEPSVFCPTCETRSHGEEKQLYFAQQSLRPTADETGFVDDIETMLNYLRSILTALELCNVIEENPGEARNLAGLGVDVAEEASRRLCLLGEELEIWKCRAQIAAGRSVEIRQKYAQGGKHPHKSRGSQGY